MQTRRTGWAFCPKLQGLGQREALRGCQGLYSCRLSRGDRKERSMEVLYACCCGIEVRAKMLVACLLKAGKKEVAHFLDDDGGLLRLLTG